MKFRERIETMQAKFPNLKVKDGYVYRRTEHTTGEVLHDVYVWKLWIPKAMTKEVIARAHDSVLCAHVGIHNTIERLRKYYFWPGLVEDVKAFINNCEVCKTSKAPNKVLRPPMGKLIESQRFFQRLYIDFLGPYPRSRGGKIGIFIVLDHFSKFVCLKAVKKMSADVILDSMEKELFYTFGVPEVVFSDNGSQFRSDKFKKLLNRFKISHMLSAVHAPQANASERVNRSIIAAIRSYIKPDQKDWDGSLSQISCALRSGIHSAIGTTPYYMAFGQQMILSGSTYSLLRKLELLEDRSLPGRFFRNYTEKSRRCYEKGT